MPELCKTPVFDGLTIRPAGLKAIISYQMFVLGRDVLRQFGDKIACFEEFYVFLKVFVILNDKTAR